ncbi:hypothetical protein Btru_038603 [Bulinus truncatus]|nr:hypothetical protein Btru_038603 [Bulinus truncatus]
MSSLAVSFNVLRASEYIDTLDSTHGPRCVTCNPDGRPKVLLGSLGFKLPPCSSAGLASNICAMVARNFLDLRGDVTNCAPSATTPFCYGVSEKISKYLTRSFMRNVSIKESR